VVLGEAVDGSCATAPSTAASGWRTRSTAWPLWTVEDLAAADGTLHPAQEAMVQCHGSQCGFCTPGFVMSLFGMYQNHTCRGEPITRELAQEELSGNLCRCTGYRPILDAAQAMGDCRGAGRRKAALHFRTVMRSFRVRLLDREQRE
jgi:xanthine dehydrogenase small subunit